MQTRVDMPFLDRASDGGTVHKWFKEPGDSIRAGEPLVEIIVGSLTVLDVPRNAKLLTRLAKKDKKKINTNARQIEQRVLWRVIAREAGTFQAIIGDGEVTVGDPLAVVEIEGGDDESTEVSELPTFRVYGERSPEEGDEG